MKKTLLAVLTASLLSANSFGNNGEIGNLIDEARNQNLSEEELATITELKNESKRIKAQTKEEMTSLTETKASEQSMLIQTKKTIYELRETMDPQTYENLLTSLTEQEKNIAGNSVEASDQDLSRYPIYIFASQSMGDAALKSLYAGVAGEKNVFIIFRGILPGENLASFSKRQHMLYKPEKDDENETRTFFPPNIQINPVLFRHFNVTDVPQMVIADPEHLNGNSTCMSYANGADISDVCYLSRISGISNHVYLQEEAKKSHFGNLGKLGDVLQISEPDMAEEMKRRAMAYDWKKAAERAKDNFFRDRKPVYLPTAIYRRTRYVDPSITVQEDVKDAYGKILLPRGMMINPLKHTLMTGKYVIFNATDKAEIQRVTDYVSAHPDDDFTFMIDDIYHDDSENGWNEYEKLVKAFKQRVYLMPDNLPHELGVMVTPTVVYADNEKQVLILEELGKIGQKTPNKSIAVEKRYQYE
ncbi:glycyl-tRNA synthetase beta chain [Ruminobacter amylophilus]|uniref:Glycyl-tRNA synthetase beta chain n=1 Tax=Ruminobacter amylophilus TaxID=867 RepID=A0A662ZJY7_9GAMM|nr:TrbC family F-type conjugative pilus assembly protein [Ruminobacter amylophilus]SFP73260.1 glycyl-tRNA synthetase beta chain [Ruminobacter amylophilus]